MLTFVIGAERAERLSVEDAAVTSLAITTTGLGFFVGCCTLVFAWDLFPPPLRVVTFLSIVLFALVGPIYRWLVPLWDGFTSLAHHSIPAALVMSCGFAAVYAGGLWPLAAIYAPVVPLLSVMICGARAAVGWTLVMGSFLFSAIAFGPVGLDLAPPPPRMALLGSLTLIVPVLLSMLLHRSVWVGAVANERELRAQVTRQIGTQRDLDKRLSEHERTESLSLMAGRIAHDLNNFLTSVSGNASLAKDQLSAGQLESVTASLIGIEQAALEAGELSRQLLDYSGKRHLTMAGIHVNKRMETALVLARAAIPGAVIVNVEYRSEAWIQGDPTQFDQIVVNLIRNAAQSYPEEADEKPINVCVEITNLKEARACAGDVLLQPGSYVRLSVEDHGLGIPADIRARIFEPFVSTKPNGKGLGLASVSGIVQAHGGGIEVESTPGRGTIFKIYVPLSEAEHKAVEPIITTDLVPVVEVPLGAVLIADDQAEVRQVLGRFVERLGFTPIFENNGADALQVILEAQHRLAAAVLDISMPRLDGGTVLKEIRRQGLTLPVVLVSGYANSESSAGIFSDPNATFLQKPFSARALSEVFAAFGVGVGEVEKAG
ncbi:MAG: ATP-binding protein [Pseudomonadota bacterium]